MKHVTDSYRPLHGRLGHSRARHSALLVGTSSQAEWAEMGRRSTLSRAALVVPLDFPLRIEYGW